MPLLSLNKAEPSLALKPRGDVTRSPKQGYQWTHVLQKLKKSKDRTSLSLTNNAKLAQSGTHQSESQEVQSPLEAANLIKGKLDHVNTIAFGYHQVRPAYI